MTIAAPLPASVAADAARQVAGRLTAADTLAIAHEAHERGLRGEYHASPAGLLLVCLSNPQGIGWRLSPIDLRPGERAAVRALAVRAYEYGRGTR